MQSFIPVFALSVFALPIAAQQTDTTRAVPPPAPATVAVQPPVATTTPGGGGGSLASRTALQAQLAQLDPHAPAAALIRARLESGDFQAGDRIYLKVDGEQQLSDTFTVGEGPQLTLPQLGAVPLTGVLRSELKDKIAGQLGQFIRSPVIDVRPLMRVLAEGEVAKPGFYAVTPELPLADVINVAGGFTQHAKVTDIRIERAGTKILAGPTLQNALGRGQSLDQLSLRPGDRIFVPSRGDSERTLRILGVLLGIPVTVVALLKVF